MKKSMKKSMEKTSKGKTHRLEDMETQFVSLVRAGANRQTKFMVVKRDTENDASDAEASGEKKPDDLLAQEQKDKQTTDDPSPGESLEDASGTNKEEAEAKDADFLAMLDATGSQIDGLLIDTQIDTAMDAFVPAPTEALGSDDTIKSAQSGTRSDAHSDNNPNEKLQKQLEAERENNARTQGELRKARELLRKNEASVKRLRSTIGKSSALSYGEVDSTESNNGSTTVPLWGSDLAEEATQEE